MGEYYDPPDPVSPFAAFFASRKVKIFCGAGLLVTLPIVSPFTLIPLAINVISFDSSAYWLLHLLEASYGIGADMPMWIYAFGQSIWTVLALAWILLLITTKSSNYTVQTDCDVTSTLSARLSALRMKALREREPLPALIKQLERNIALCRELLDEGGEADGLDFNRTQVERLITSVSFYFEVRSNAAEYGLDQHALNKRYTATVAAAKGVADLLTANTADVERPELQVALLEHDDTNAELAALSPNHHREES